MEIRAISTHFLCRHRTLWTDKKLIDNPDCLGRNRETEGTAARGSAPSVQIEIDFKMAEGTGSLRSSEMSRCNVVRAGPSGAAGWV